MKLFNHIQIKVEDLEISKNFYDSIMKILGYQTVLEIDNTVVGYGTSVHDMFEIRQASNESKLSVAVHIAFNAASMQQVELFYQTAMENGAKCNGIPGFRPEYEDGYYSAFIIDPDGNNVEAVTIYK
ncbi:MAG: VOC family protein [Legionellales bacterium]|nr:VOC family protein [Legionellales bacterium]